MKIQIVKIKDAGCMYTPIPVTGCQLLKQIHIPELQIIMFFYMIVKACKKTILIKIVIHNLFAKIYKHLITCYKRKSTRRKTLFAQGEL
jgi:hypothetical protein